MNTSSGIWDIPPPPGTEDEDPVSDSSKINLQSSRAIDRIDPYLKNPQYLEYEKKSGRHNRRSRSHSYDRFEKRRHSRSRSRSKSRHRYRRSRSSSKSRSHRRKNHTKSRSRSQSKSVSKHSRRNKERKSRHSSRSRNSSRSRHSSRSKYSRSRSRSGSRSKSHKLHRANKSRRTSKEHSDYEEKPVGIDVNHDIIDMKVEEEEEPEQDSTKDNAFKNDGSFLEMFKKMQEEKQAQEEAQKADAEKQKSLPAFGKRRGGRVLKTGMVLKSKPQDSEESAHDPWSVYMKEVKRYKEACCDDDSKTRPLVKGFHCIEVKMSGGEVELKTAPFDPRFPNTNQTRYCYQSYLDYHRCQKVRGTNYAPCEYFNKVFHSICPNNWVERWDSQREEGTFAGNI